MGGAVALNKRTRRGRVEGSVNAMTDFNLKRKELEKERIKKAIPMIERGLTNADISRDLGVSVATISRYRSVYEENKTESILTRVQQATQDPEGIAFIKETRPDIAFYLEKGMDFILSDVNVKNIVITYFK